jgi:hypothetical protein
MTRHHCTYPGPADSATHIRLGVLLCDDVGGVAYPVRQWYRRVDLIETSRSPLRPEVAGGTPTKEVTDVVENLTIWMFQMSAGRGRAGKALREARYKVSTDVLADAVVDRKRQPGQGSGTGDTDDG